MLQCNFHIYFIFLIYVIIQVNHCILQDGEGSTLSDIEPKRKCTVQYCTCADIPRWDGVDCEPVDWTAFPRLNFRRFKYFPEGMLLGLRLNQINLFDPEGNVAENFLEGILGLEKFSVYQSRIKVIYLLILKIIQTFSLLKSISLFSF